MIKRTPPKGTNQPSISQASSEPVLTTPCEDLSKDRITLRQKRRHDTDVSADLISLREDIMSSIATLRLEQSEIFSSLQSGLDVIKTQNMELQATVDFLSNKYDDVLERLAFLEHERKSALGYIRTLEEKVENLEKNSKSSSLEIRNVPKTSGETKEDLIKIIKTIGIAVNNEIHAHELRDVYRIINNSKPENNGPITAEFSSVITRNKLLTNVKKYNRANRTNRLNTSHINLAGNMPIFISESLTTKVKRLYYKAREFSKRNDYAYHWTSHGKVFIKKREGATARRIDQESDFEGLEKEQEK
ncbi:unnamed protein product [Arctia plantaginis]|uniref:FP protein C-terminal domain-containing protein n=1 Tax=Arctia plantaginis TaxID=874455 RepID=A0A8S0YYC2_ARCPL|nr:unnamed protein product [Arctia plantaginis]